MPSLVVVIRSSSLNSVFIPTRSDNATAFGGCNPKSDGLRREGYFFSISIRIGAGFGTVCHHWLSIATLSGETRAKAYSVPSHKYGTFYHSSDNPFSSVLSHSWNIVDFFRTGNGHGFGKPHWHNARQSRSTFDIGVGFGTVCHHRLSIATLSGEITAYYKNRTWNMREFWCENERTPNTHAYPLSVFRDAFALLRSSSWLRFS